MIDFCLFLFRCFSIQIQISITELKKGTDGVDGAIADLQDSTYRQEKNNFS